jgi:hypothetical protein
MASILPRFLFVVFAKGITSVIGNTGLIASMSICPFCFLASGFIHGIPPGGNSSGAGEPFSSQLES